MTTGHPRRHCSGWARPWATPSLAAYASIKRRRALCPQEEAVLWDPLLASACSPLWKRGKRSETERTEGPRERRPRAPRGHRESQSERARVSPRELLTSVCREPSFEESFRDLAPHSLRCEAGTGCEDGSTARISSGSLHGAHGDLLGTGVRKGHLAKRPVFLYCW